MKNKDIKKEIQNKVPFWGCKKCKKIKKKGDGSLFMA
jgi:hypothetical protein